MQWSCCEVLFSLHKRENKSSPTKNNLVIDSHQSVVDPLPAKDREVIELLIFIFVILLFLVY